MLKRTGEFVYEIQVQWRERKKGCIVSTESTVLEQNWIFFFLEIKLTSKLVNI